jgi:hypothetical protein
MEEAQERLGQATTDNSRLREELEAASSELAAVEEYANRRCAVQGLCNASVFACIPWVPAPRHEQHGSQESKQRSAPPVARE